jgi:hypothetical protein
LYYRFLEKFIEHQVLRLLKTVVDTHPDLLKLFRRTLQNLIVEVEVGESGPVIDSIDIFTRDNKRIVFDVSVGPSAV